MSVSRRASFAAGIAAARRNNSTSRSRGSTATGAGVSVGCGVGLGGEPALSVSGVGGAGGAGDDPATVANTITVVAGPPSGGGGGGGGGEHGAGISSPQQQHSQEQQEQLPYNNDRPALDLMDSKGSTTTFGLAAVAKAATVAAKKPRIQYEVRPFTRESLEKINIRTNNLIRDYGFLPKRSPNLQDGAQLPAKFEPFPPELLGKPVEELDQYVYEKTFCVVSRRFNKHFVQRFSATRALFLFAPWHKIRTTAIRLLTNQYFDYVVMITILVNCVFLAMTTPIDEAEYIFLVIYSLEMVIKGIARGFILNNYTYLRNPWNWLDFTVIISGYLTSFIEMGNLAGLRTFRVLRAFKTVSIMPSLKTIINALLNAVKQLAEVMTLTVFCLMVFALFALQVYMGQLRNKCVLEMDTTKSHNWTEWILDENHWFFNDKNNPELCGNSSGARSCPHGYICLPNIGDNPNFGYTSFDNLLWAMLTTFQLITLDYWENVYNMIVATGGPIHVIFFTIVVFFGSFYLINLMLAVVAMSYEEEAEANSAERAKEADEAAANAKRCPPEEECTIRTNPPLGKDSKPGSLNEDMCGRCQEKSGSLEALSKAAAPNGSGGEANPGSSRVVLKARQVGNQIRSVDLHESSQQDPGGAVASSGATPEVKNGSAEQTTFHKGRDKGRIEAKFNLTVPLKPSPSAEEAAGIRQLLSPPPQEDRASVASSHRTSLNDSGVFGEDLENLSDVRAQGLNTDEGHIINCQNSRPPNQIEIPVVVAIETGNDRNCPGCRKCCLDYDLWLRFQNLLFVIVHDMLFDATVTLCIVLNTAFLAAEHHGMSNDLKYVLDTGNKVFTSFFTLEAVLKLCALSKDYFASGWNIFDLIIVIASLIDLSVESVNGISVLRGMRLMRVLKLAQSWTTMKVLLSIIISTLGALGNLTFLLIIVIYIFAVLGMQIFGKTYTAENFYPERVPRWNFTDFFHSFMMIFRILCGEWIEPLWDCMRAEAKVGVAESCLAIFLPALVMGNFMVLNLFLALLLNSFNCEELKSRKERERKEARERSEAKKRKKLLKKQLKAARNKKNTDLHEVKGESGSIVTSKLSKFKDKMLGKKRSKQDQEKEKFSSNGSLLSQNGVKSAFSEPDVTKQMAMAGADDPEGAGGPAAAGVAAGVVSASSVAVAAAELVHLREDDPDLEEGRTSRSEQQEISSLCKSKSLTFEEGLKEAMNPDDSSSLGEKKSSEPDPCCPAPCNKFFSFCTCCNDTLIMRAWEKMRKIIHDIVDNPFFEWTILLLIFASSLSLCFEDINLQNNEELMFILKIVNLVFAVLFTIEMLLKWIAFGLWRYFTSMWTCLDFVIVCVSILSLAIEGSANLTALRSLRTLRALRPLRAISRWQGMKIVVNALMYAIPSIFNVLLVCLVFWLIFSIMGVQFFGGKFYKCLDDEGSRLPIDIVNDKWECAEKNFTWANSKITFDHVGHAYLALFQVATFEGWMEVMADAVDAREVDEQPDWEASIYNYFYFVIFIVCGSFFTLNLFIGVIIDNFNMLKKKYEGGVLEMFLTESQKNYYTAMKKLGRKKPQKVIRRPKNEIHAIFYDISLSRRFEIAIFVLIFLNMVSMGIEHYNQSRVITFTLEICNALFTTIFSLEACVKIIGLRFQYFTAGWNIFDFVLVIASIIGIVMEDMMTDFPVSPTLLRVVRVFRIGRILRLIKAAKGIRKLLFALIVSLPALFNIGALLALITFIYAIIGMTLFGHVMHQGALNDQVNFETFGRSMQLLFRLVTSAGWNDVLEPLLITPPDCDPNYKNLPNGNCGHPFVAMVYFVSFIIINFMIVINMYIAIILENFNQAHQEEEIGIVEEDLEMFYTKWSKYDPHATQFINFHQMSDFIASLDSPLGIPKPNTLALVSFDLPIAKGDKIHCLDVLHSLTKYTLGFVDDGSEDFSKLASQMDEKFKKQFPTRKELEIVSSTREWKRLDNAARILQRFFREIQRAKATGERINIQTQTCASKKKVAPVMSAQEQNSRTLYQDSDIDWKTHSLPSLGRVSSENTLASSGDDYSIRKSVRRNKKNGRAQSMVVTDDDEVREQGNETEETHGSEELDHFSGYSTEYRPRQNRHHPTHLPRQMSTPAGVPSNSRYDQQHSLVPSVGSGQGGMGNPPEARHAQVSPPNASNPHYLLQSYSEEPPPPTPPPAAAMSRQHSSQTSLHAYSEYAGHHRHRRTPSTGSYNYPSRHAYEDGQRPLNPKTNKRLSCPDYHQMEFNLEQQASAQQQPLNSRDRFLSSTAGAQEVFTAPLSQAPLISPNNPGHSVVQHYDANAAEQGAVYRRRYPEDASGYRHPPPPHVDPMPARRMEFDRYRAQGAGHEADFDRYRAKGAGAGYYEDQQYYDETDTVRRQRTAAAGDVADAGSGNRRGWQGGQQESLTLEYEEGGDYQELLEMDYAHGASGQGAAQRQHYQEFNPGYEEAPTPSRSKHHKDKSPKPKKASRKAEQGHSGSPKRSPKVEKEDKDKKKAKRKSTGHDPGQQALQEGQELELKYVVTEQEYQRIKEHSKLKSESPHKAGAAAAATATSSFSSKDKLTPPQRRPDQGSPRNRGGDRQRQEPGHRHGGRRQERGGADAPNTTTAAVDVHSTSEVSDAFDEDGLFDLGGVSLAKERSPKKK